jgi:predicted amidohydrolase YtcJ
VARKRADMVVLDKSPLTVEAVAITDIQVPETINEGKTIFTEE